MMSSALTLNSVDYSNSAISSGRATCFLDESERSLPLSEERLDALEASVVEARAVPTAFSRGLALAASGKQYACFRQQERASALLVESLSLVDEFEKTTSQARLLVDVAVIYGEQLGDLDRMDELFSRAIDLAQTTIENSSTHYIVFSNIVRQYALINDYSSLLDVANLVDDPLTRQHFIQDAMVYVEYFGSNEELNRFLSFFPEIADLPPRSPTPCDQSVRLNYHAQPIGWRISVNSRALETCLGEYPETIDEFVTAQIVKIETLPSPASQAYSYVTLGTHLLETVNHPQQAIILLELAIEEMDSLQDVDIPSSYWFTLNEPHITNLLLQAYCAVESTQDGSCIGGTEGFL